MQGALGLIAAPLARTQLEQAGLDWKTLCAVASGQYKGEAEVSRSQNLDLADVKENEL